MSNDGMMFTLGTFGICGIAGIAGIAGSCGIGICGTCSSFRLTCARRRRGVVGGVSYQAAGGWGCVYSSRLDVARPDAPMRRRRFR